ncbi:MAG: transcriptional repressor [Candidatus Poribacteria bacterium]|nr:MAG: transcriptional repressor [Candidatus Poribacteria bacterium]
MEIGFLPHAHQQCVAEAVAQAEALCRLRRVRFTPLRRRVFELVWESHRPIGAYEILDRLREERGQTPAPPTVYRALEFLLSQGLIHRIAAQNAYVGCSFPRRPHRGQFFVCQECGNVVETSNGGINRAIEQTAEELGFSPSACVVEIYGLCPTCQEGRRE